MNIIKIDKYKNDPKETKQLFYCGIQNWYEHYWKTEQNFYERPLNRTQPHFGELNNKHIQIQETSNEPQNSPQKRLTKIFNQQLTSTHYLST